MFRATNAPAFIKQDHQPAADSTTDNRPSISGQGLPVIPGRASSRGPGIHTPCGDALCRTPIQGLRIPGSRCARPGMTRQGTLARRHPIHFFRERLGQFSFAAADNRPELCTFPSMKTKKLTEVLERIEVWPPDAQNELSDIALEFDAGLSDGDYEPTPRSWPGSTAGCVPRRKAASPRISRSRRAGGSREL